MSYRRVREENIKPEYLRLKQAMIVFNMGPDKIEELARECGAYYKHKISLATCKKHNDKNWL